MLLKISCWEQFVAVFLGQISDLVSLREIVDAIKFHSNQQYHLGIKKDIARSTLAKANETRDGEYIEMFFTTWFQSIKEINITNRLNSLKLLILLLPI